MAVPNVFKDITTLSHNERIANALVDLLAADSEIAAFTGGRIKRIPDPLWEPDLLLPFIIVALVDETFEFETSGRATVFPTLLISSVYEDSREIVTATDVTAASLTSLIGKTLHATAAAIALKVTRYSNQPLVDAITTFQVVDYNATIKSQQSFGTEEEIIPTGPSSIVRYLSLGIRYRYLMERSTWLKVGFTP